MALVCAGVAGNFRTGSEAQGSLHASVQSKVEVKIDDAGVVHIFALSRKDAAFAMGVVHGQNRGLQLDVAKRMAHGRLSELAGQSALGHDTLVRRLQLGKVARRQFEQLPSREKELLSAYAQGVNSAIRSRGFSLQHWINGVPALEWDGEDCIAWSLFMAFQLSGNWQSELDRLQLSANLPPADVRLLLPGTVAPGSRGVDDQSPAITSFALLDGTLPALQESTGSNAWAVSSARSRSGGALLANDPHLPLTSPSPWLFARISVASEDPQERQDVIGATSPGLPMVLVGRTEYVAWGITRNGADTQDLFLEELDPADPKRYKADAGWELLDQHEELIYIRGSASRTIDVAASANGPIVGSVKPSHAEAAEPEQKVALRWAALYGTAGSISAAFAAHFAHMLRRYRT